MKLAIFVLSLATTVLGNELWEYTYIAEEQKGGKTIKQKPITMRSCLKDSYSGMQNIKLPDQSSKSPDCKLVSTPADFNKLPMTLKFNCTEGGKKYTMEQTFIKQTNKEMEIHILMRYENGDTKKAQMIGKYIGNCK
ncbi:MAG: DUF3617 family protein [Aquificaceae bacterium]|nr:DUF3617 family protein [Aquificaceae bacterium]MDW8237486.1 DUF3617 family protein [Aquificaceae bacterium]